MLVFSAASFRVVGNAGSQNLFTIWNGSVKTIRLQELIVNVDATAALATVVGTIRSSRITTAPTGGFVLNKTPWEPASQASDSGIVVRSPADSDGGTLTAVVVTPGVTIWQSLSTRLHTAVGQVIPYRLDLCPQKDLVIRPNQGIVVHVSGSNPATNHYLVQALWGEANN